MPEQLQPIDLTGIERVLVVTAHPDDVDFGFAGSVATMTDAGIDVTYCIVTDGDAGGSETGTPRAGMGPLRQGERTPAGRSRPQPRPPSACTPSTSSAARTVGWRRPSTCVVTSRASSARSVPTGS